MWTDFWAKAGTIAVKPIPLGIVMTVSGTGSEMNGGAVITNEDIKVKTGRDYPALNAQFALLDRFIPIPSLNCKWFPAPLILLRT